MIVFGGDDIWTTSTEAWSSPFLLNKSQSLQSWSITLIASFGTLRPRPSLWIFDELWSEKFSVTAGYTAGSRRLEVKGKGFKLRVRVLVNLNLTNKLVRWKFDQLIANLPPVLGRIQDSRCKDFIPSLYSGQKTERDEKRFSAPLEKRLRATARRTRDVWKMKFRTW